MTKQTNHFPLGTYDRVHPTRSSKKSLRASPKARLLARNAHIDLSHVDGTGLDGRITELDVLVSQSLRGRGVFVLQHVHTFPGGRQDVKMIGVYSTHGMAQEAIARLLLQPGFQDAPGGSSIDTYPLDEDHWAEGHVTLRVPLPPAKRRTRPKQPHGE